MHTNAGVYSDTWTFTDATGNYNNASGTVTDTIAKANATITVIGYTGVYDGQAHAATGTASGVNSEDLSGLLHLGSTFTNVPGGTATWTFDGNDNYNSATGSVAIVITKANATIDVTGYTLTYSGSADTAAGTATAHSGRSARWPGPHRHSAHQRRHLYRHLELHGCHGQLQQRQRHGDRHDQ